MHINIVGTICAIGAGLFFGFIGPFTKIGFNLGAGIGLAILLRYWIATSIIIPVILIKKPTILLFQNNLTMLLILTTGSILLTSGLLLSVKYIDVSLAILIFCTYPIIVLVTSIIVDKEKIAFSIKFVFLVIFIGLCLVLTPSFENLNLIGVSSAFIASIGASIMILVNQKLSNKNIDPIYINAFTNLFNSIFFSSLFLLFFHINFKISFEAWLAILIPSFCYAIAFFLQLLAIPKIGQSKTALLLYTEPVVAILASIILLKETLNIIQAFGAIIVITGLIFSTYKTSQ